MGVFNYPNISWVGFGADNNDVKFLDLLLRSRFFYGSMWRDLPDEGHLRFGSYFRNRYGRKLMNNEHFSNSDHNVVPWYLIILWLNYFTMHKCDKYKELMSKIRHLWKQNGCQNQPFTICWIGTQPYIS